MVLPLSEIETESTAIIREIRNTPLALRLYELGFTIGTEIKALFKSTKENCTAYLIKGTVIALRQEDARNINVLI